MAGTGMKRALTFGCGTGNASPIVDVLLEKNYHVTNIGSSAHPLSENVLIDWQDLEITNLHLKFQPGAEPIDFVFFNQNGSSLDIDAFDPVKDDLAMWKLIKDWQHTHWISCQMPVLLLHYIRKNLHVASKVGWMLSGMMCYNRPGVDQYPDYSSQKYFNYLAMRCFARHYETFGIVPDFGLPGSQQALIDAVAKVCDHAVRAEVFRLAE